MIETLLGKPQVGEVVTVDSDRFLIPGPDILSDRQFYRASEQFWLGHDDLLPDGVGAVIQTGASSDNAWSLGNTTCIFDARKREAAGFTWQLTVAAASGRSIIQLVSKPEATAGQHFELDAQGRLAKKWTLNRQELASAQQQVHGLTSSQEMKDGTSKLRDRKKVASEALARYAVTEVAWHQRQRMDNHCTELETRQRAADKLGFPPLGLYMPPLTTMAAKIAETSQRR
jgi:hypothetical protein